MRAAHSLFVKFLTFDTTRHFNGDESFIAFPDNPMGEKKIPKHRPHEAMMGV
jgi:hypothetical protein